MSYATRLCANCGKPIQLGDWGTWEHDRNLEGVDRALCLVTATPGKELF